MITENKSTLLYIVCHTLLRSLSQSQVEGKVCTDTNTHLHLNVVPESKTTHASQHLGMLLTV